MEALGFIRTLRDSRRTGGSSYLGAVVDEGPGGLCRDVLLPVTDEAGEGDAAT